MDRTRNVGIRYGCQVLVAATQTLSDTVRFIQHALVADDAHCLSSCENLSSLVVTIDLRTWWAPQGTPAYTLIGTVWMQGIKPINARNLWRERLPETVTNAEQCSAGTVTKSSGFGLNDRHNTRSHDNGIL